VYRTLSRREKAHEILRDFERRREEKVGREKKQGELLYAEVRGNEEGKADVEVDGHHMQSVSKGALDVIGTCTEEIYCNGGRSQHKKLENARRRPNTE